MNRRADFTLLILGFTLAMVAGLVITLAPPPAENTVSTQMDLLSDPFLQVPTPNSVRVVWFTAFPGQAHTVQYGPRSEPVAATTRPVSRLQEDADSDWNAPPDLAQTGDPPAETPIPRSIWRHEAEITGLTPGERLPYSVSSTREDGTVITSGPFSLAASPPMGQPLQILLTSDHQQMPMTATNLQKVAETSVGSMRCLWLATW